MSAAHHPKDLTLLGSIPRTGRFNLLWSLSIALFLWAIEWAGRDEDQRYGLMVNLAYAMCLGYWCWTIVGMVWLAEARRRWPKLPDARERFDRRGVYGLVGWPAIAFCAIVGIPLACLFGVFLAQAILAFPWWPMEIPRERPPFAVSLVLSYSITILTFTIDYLRVRLAANEVRAEAAQRQALQTQLRLLQAQLEPHMMFNTLANLHALIESDPARAQDMLARLITFLRATLGGSRTTTHPLSTEFARVDDYLALMQVRMGPRLQVKLELPAELASHHVPTLLLQPLVENAVKHGLEPNPPGGQLILRARVEDSTLVLCVIDTGRGLRAAEAARQGPPGFGMACVRDRVQSAYGGTASLSMQESTGHSGTIVTLRLPLNTAVSPAPALSTGSISPFGPSVLPPLDEPPAHALHP
ncbi:sensor histidine kinase [Aquabacterium soli]|nr:histidine kinase [Aquabacterium soli]